MAISIVKLLNSEPGLVIISVILGLGLAALFRKACTDNRCIVVRGPDPNEVKKYVWKVNEVCYKYKPVFDECR